MAQIGTSPIPTVSGPSAKLAYSTLLGTPIPENTPHAVSVTLPTWRDNVGYEEGDERVHSALQSGYPRFVYHEQVRKIMALCEKKFAKSSETCLVLPSRRVAEECRDFLHSHSQPVRSPASGSISFRPNISSSPSRRSLVRIAEFAVTPTHNPYSPQSDDPSTSIVSSFQIYVVLFPCEAKGIAKQFWQHSGEGISSRFAEHCLRVLDANDRSKDFAAPVPGVRGMSNPRYRKGAYLPEGQQQHLATAEGQAVRNEQDLYVEERFGRNLDVRQADDAKQRLKKRIAGVLGDADNESSIFNEIGPSIIEGASSNLGGRGILGIADNDVYLFPTGMSAIYNAHRIARKIHPNKKSVQYGFPYLDSLKIQQKFGPGCHFLGLGDSSEIDHLENSILQSEPISAVFCEFPSNPLLRTPDLQRLRRLADRYDFLLIVDETVGNFINVDAMSWADIVVSSLTKIFSGDSNVMGGSAVINPKSRWYEELAVAMKELYQDNVWCEDAIFLERNSRSFGQRIRRINHTAEILCDFLHTQPKVLQVHYPKYVDSHLYQQHARPDESGRYGYGGLFSLILHTDDAAVRFFDALEIAKGPSLGTNFTLASPYTILAHYGELDWAAQYKVPQRLIRVSVGLEDPDTLLRVFANALNSI
ncbi:hypothetical protein SpCBS45565_g02907 [Spizellomyces sp. 'palustris']|nr:hypothetical protein SpCBS45565_g02907 [Spizellomyces sp. 'palustris']